MELGRQSFDRMLATSKCIRRHTCTVDVLITNNAHARMNLCRGWLAVREQQRLWNESSKKKILQLTTTCQLNDTSFEEWSPPPPEQSLARCKSVGLLACDCRVHSAGRYRGVSADFMPACWIEGACGNRASLPRRRVGDDYAIVLHGTLEKLF